VDIGIVGNRNRINDIVLFTSIYRDWTGNLGSLCVYNSDLDIVHNLFIHCHSVKSIKIFERQVNEIC
jgi:hypothetical protein